MGHAKDATLAVAATNPILRRPTTLIAGLAWNNDYLVSALSVAAKLSLG